MRTTINLDLRSHYLIFMILLSISVIICVILLRLKEISQLISTTRNYILMLGQELRGFYLFKTFMYDNLNGFMTLLMAPVVVISLIMKGRRDFQTNLFYLCIFVPIMLSLNNDLFLRFFLFFLPRRSVIFLTLLAWVIFARSLHIISSQHLRFSWFHRKIMGFQKFSSLSVTLIIFLLFSTQLSPALKFHRNKSFIIWGPRDFWSESPCEVKGTESSDCNHPADYEYPADYLAAVWIDQNIPVEDLILNDLSWASLYLQSFSVKNVVFSLIPGNLQRAIECRVIWDQPDHPSHKQILIGLIEKYGIKYLWVTAEWGFFDWWEISGDDEYKRKKKNSSIYIEIFDNYHFLTSIFQIENSKIYKVTFEMS